MKVSEFVSENRFELFKSFLTYVTYFILGSSSGLVGSSLLDLQILTGTDFAQITLLLTLRSGGHVVGTIIASILDARFNTLSILSLSNLCTGVFLALGPFLVKYDLIAACFFIFGTSLGVADVLCNTLLARIWKDKCANFLQVLHMSQGVGALLTPIITRFFLLPSEDYTGEGVDINVIPSTYSSEDVIIQYAFLIIGTISVINSIPFMIIYMKKDLTVTKQLATSTSGSSVDQDAKLDISKVKVYLGVIIVAAINHSVYCLEILIGSLGTPFSVKSDLHMDKKVGVLLATVFWSCFSFTRLIYIPLTFVINESKLQIVSLIISLIGILITVPWAIYDQLCIWIGFTLIGIGISPIFAASLGMLNKYVSVTSRMTSIILIVGIIGESFHPAMAALLMADNMIIFLYYIAFFGVSYVILFLVLIVYCKKCLKPSIQRTITQDTIATISVIQT